MVNLLQLEENENLTAILPVKTFDSTRRLFMVTRRGVCKMVMLSAFSRPTARGIIALKLDEGDELVSVKTILGGEQVVIATRNGYAIRFGESEVRVMGRISRGVKAITFRDKNDEVIGMEVFSRQREEGEAETAAEAVPADAAAVVEGDDGIDEAEVFEEVIDDTVDENAPVPEDNSRYEGKLLTVSALGFGKQTDVNSYRVTHRGGKGVINLKIMDKTGEVLAIKRMFESDELMVVTTNGKVVRLNVDSIRNTGRAASGVKLITLDGDDRLISVVRIPASEEKAN